MRRSSRASNDRRGRRASASRSRSKSPSRSPDRRGSKIQKPGGGGGSRPASREVLEDLDAKASLERWVRNHASDPTPDGRAWGKTVALWRARNAADLHVATVIAATTVWTGDTTVHAQTVAELLDEVEQGAASERHSVGLSRGRATPQKSSRRHPSFRDYERAQAPSASRKSSTRSTRETTTAGRPCCFSSTSS